MVQDSGGQCGNVGVELPDVDRMALVVAVGYGSAVEVSKEAALRGDDGIVGVESDEVMIGKCCSAAGQGAASGPDRLACTRPGCGGQPRGQLPHALPPAALRAGVDK